jgi:hypothetical protein
MDLMGLANIDAIIFFEHFIDGGGKEEALWAI